MTLPPLPKPTLADGRLLFTTAQMREYAQAAVHWALKDIEAKKRQDMPEFLRGMRR